MSVEFSRRQALDLWRDVTVASVRGDEPDLTARQLAVLMLVYCNAGPHTVRGLSESLQIGKPAVSRALDALEKLGLARRKRDESDLRSVLVERTLKGSGYLAGLADRISERAKGIN
jgi:DNA-binding MarR family transcriptional regulator